MSARDELYELAVCGDDRTANEKIDAFKAEVERNLIYRMRRQLAAGLKMTGFATVMVLGGGAEPMGVTHILDAWDPDQPGMRPAREALEELRGWTF